MPRVLWDMDVQFNDMTVLRMAFRLGMSASRVFSYLPLQQGDAYCTGITVYSVPGGIAGIAVHGECSRLFGSRKGCARHLALGTNERVVSVYVRVLGKVSRYDIMIGAQLMVSTPNMLQLNPQSNGLYRYERIEEGSSTSAHCPARSSTPRAGGHWRKAWSSDCLPDWIPLRRGP